VHSLQTLLGTPVLRVFLASVFNLQFFCSVMIAILGPVDAAGSEQGTRRIEPQENPAGGLPAAFLYLEVLGGGMYVAEAALERRGLEDCARTCESIEQIDGCHAILGRRQSPVVLRLVISLANDDAQNGLE
jgi:hypothetical protein